MGEGVEVVGVGKVGGRVVVEGVGWGEGWYNSCTSVGQDVQKVSRNQG